MNSLFWQHSQLPTLCQQLCAMDMSAWQPRRTLNLADKKADWKAALAQLQRFASSDAYLHPGDFQAHAALENYWQWQSQVQEASILLVFGIDLGMPPAQLQSLYREFVALWLAVAEVGQHARNSLQAQTGEAAGVTAPIATRTVDGYRHAVLMLSLAVLLDVQDEIPALVDKVLEHDTDRLLDYLCAAALELESASDDLFHRRPYGDLEPFFDQLGEASPEPLLPYLQTQYTDFHRLSPKQQKKGGTWAGTWYWALEVAALGVLYGWDDTAMRACKHYPADLVDFGRRSADSAP